MQIRILGGAAVAALLCIAATPQGPPGANVDAAKIAAADSDPGEWLSHGRTYSEQRFSPLKQINTSSSSASPGNTAPIPCAGWKHRPSLPMA